jgi:hypothetical protein
MINTLIVLAGKGITLLYLKRYGTGADVPYLKRLTNPAASVSLCVSFGRLILSIETCNANRISPQRTQRRPGNDPFLPGFSVSSVLNLFSFGVASGETRVRGKLGEMEPVQNSCVTSCFSARRARRAGWRPILRDRNSRRDCWAANPTRCVLQRPGRNRACRFRGRRTDRA